MAVCAGSIGCYWVIIEGCMLCLFAVYFGWWGGNGVFVGELFWFMSNVCWDSCRVYWGYVGVMLGLLWGYVGLFWVYDWFIMVYAGSI